MEHYLFTSESVSNGHPDKVADQIADAIVDACLEHDPQARVACNVLITRGLVVITGEISSRHIPDYRQIAERTIRAIGYDDATAGFDYRSYELLINVKEQSPDIAQGVNEGEGLYKEQGAGDQGMMFGFACDETPELMPLPISLAHRLQFALLEQRSTGAIPYLRPDAKTQVTIEYGADHTPLRVHTVVISTQHTPDVEHSRITQDMKELIQQIIPKPLLDDKTIYFVNPTGRFVIGGPESDCGLTGRKLMVDTYGAMGRHGGGAFSGKDPTKVDRSGAYAMRYVAKTIVAARLARRCEIQVAYAIGVPYPISIKVDTFGTGTVSEDRLARLIPTVFDLTPKGIITMLNLQRPIYQQTAFGGHFGREIPGFPWEKTDRVPSLLQAIYPNKLKSWPTERAKTPGL